MKRLLLVCSCAVLLGLSSTSATSQPVLQVTSAVGNKARAGIATSDWTKIRRAYDRSRQGVFAVSDGYQTRAYGGQWLVHFDGRGFDIQPRNASWSWGLQLESYGSVAQQSTASTRPTVHAAGNELRYAWNSDVQEWWVKPTGSTGTWVHDLQTTGIGRPVSRSPASNSRRLTAGRQ